MAKLYFRYGAMNCGKSAALMQVAHNYEENGKEIVLIKSTIDTKADDRVESRIGIRRKVDILLGDNESLVKYFDYLKEFVSCVICDESQFFTEEQVEELWYISKILDIPVICYGLRTDFQSNLFPGSKRLLELADELDELITICSCGKRAKFNARFINNNFSLEGDQVSIDGANDEIKYKPLCGKCYIKKKMEYKSGV